MDDIRSRRTKLLKVWGLRYALSSPHVRRLMDLGCGECPVPRRMLIVHAQSSAVAAPVGALHHTESFDSEVKGVFLIQRRRGSIHVVTLTLLLSKYCHVTFSMNRAESVSFDPYSVIPEGNAFARNASNRMVRFEKSFSMCTMIEFVCYPLTPSLQNDCDE